MALKSVIGFITEIIPDGTSTSITVSLKHGPIWAVLTNNTGASFSPTATPAFDFSRLLPAISVQEVNFNGASASLSTDGESITFTWTIAPLGILLMYGKLEVSA